MAKDGEFPPGMAVKILDMVDSLENLEKLTEPLRKKSKNEMTEVSIR